MTAGAAAPGPARPDRVQLRGAAAGPGRHPAGRRRAAGRPRTAAARLLARHEPTVIVTSDLSRAHETRELPRARDGPRPSSSTPGCASARSACGRASRGDDLRRRLGRRVRRLASRRTSRQGVGAETRAEVAAARAGGDPRARRGAGSRTTPSSSSRTAPRSAARSATCSGCRPTGAGFTGMLNVHWTELRRHPRRLRPAVAAGRLQPRARPTRRATGTPDPTPRTSPTPTPRRGTPISVSGPRSF